MMYDPNDLIQLATALIMDVQSGQRFAKITPITARNYRNHALRIESIRVQQGSEWAGIDSLTDSQGYYQVMRAAWSRFVHREVARALHDIRNERDIPEAIQRLEVYYGEALRCPPRPLSTTLTPTGAGQQQHRAMRSKKHSIETLPDNWLDQIWAAAVTRWHPRLNEIAILLATGCRPCEVGNGVKVAVVSEDVIISLHGAKVSTENGQPWRSLRMAIQPGCTAHLAALADAAGGSVMMASDLSAAGLSMAIAALGEDCHFGQRVSAIDVRHQRSADVKNTLHEPELVAAWLGHASSRTATYYGRLPRGRGSRGATPVGVSVPREVRVHARSPKPIQAHT
jgi:integrase